MHYLKKGLGIIAVTTLLTACGETATTDPTEQETPAEPQEEVLTVEDVLRESTEVMSSVQSFSADMEQSQEMELPDGESFSSDSTMMMEMTQEPLALYQKMKMTVPEMGEMETEMYMVENGIYFKDTMEDAWFTYPEELTQELGNIEDMQIQPEEQLELLTKHAEHLLLEEADSHYIVTIEGSSDILQGFAEEMNRIMSDDLSAEMDHMMSMADIQELDYTLYIDKETFLQTQMDMTMVFELNTEGESMKILTTTNAVFSNFDEIEEIIVPADVLESATEFGTDFPEFEEMSEADFEDSSEVGAE